MKIIIGADFYPVRRVEDFLKRNEFEYLLGEIKPYITKADYSLVNYESTFYGDGVESPKFGPSMATDEQSVRLVKWCGFKCSTLANNHIHDYGNKGLHDLLECMQRHNIDYVGAGLNLKDANETLFKEICGERIAFINCCEHEFNIADENQGGANPLNIIQQYYAIKEACINAKRVIVIVHGGSINCQIPSPRMQETYRFFIDSGASAVINHHQHCYSGYEYYHGAPIIYGLGNLFFDKPWLKNTTWTEGYLVQLNIEQDNPSIKIEILPYTQCADEPNVKMLEGDEKVKFFKSIETLNSIIKDPKLLKEKYNQWVDSNEEMCVNAFMYLQNPKIRALLRRKLIPRFTVDSLYTLNYLYCESHYDRILRYLKKKFKLI